MKSNTIYFLPGHGRQLDAGLGQGVLDLGFDVVGRETRGDFRNLPFQEQVDLIANDLKSYFWTENSCVLANSFGAYLFLHAQAQLTPFVGKVLLLSPIVGGFQNESIGMGFIPPRADKILKLAREGVYPKPQNCEIYVGANDWQSNPDNVKQLGNLLCLPVTIVPDVGHQLGKDYVNSLLLRWLN